METKKSRPRSLILRTEEQRKAVSSPLRMELLGQFVDGSALSVAEIAERMGRPATAIHYHVRILEKAGVLRRAGSRRSGRRSEALYRPTADTFKMAAPREAPGEAAEAALSTMASAFRMAERDMRAAFENPDVKTSGPYRNAFGARLHCRLAKKELAELNRHLRAIETLLMRARKTREPSPNDAFVSLTVALMPLRDRKA